MKMESNEKKARKNLLRKSEEAKGKAIKGYDFNGGINYGNVIESFGSTGFQASHLAKAIEITKKGINRIGNIYASNNRYVDFEEFMQPLLEEIYQEHKKSGEILCGSDLIWKMGEKINNEKSIYYWAWKNKIPVYYPALTDGSLGDNIYFFSFKHDDFKIDIVEDTKRLNNTTIGLKKSGAVILGAGVVKHAILNANMLRNGLDYGVYINTEQEFDSSDAGALPEEAISWGKILPNAESVKVFADATIVFPILVAESFAEE